MFLVTTGVFFIKYNMLTSQPSRPLCKKCTVSLAKPNGKSKHGFQQWHKYCSSCAKQAYDSKFGFLLNKKTYCEECKFIAKDQCQLDIVYKDNNNKNKSKSNMKTLCANCNRLYQKNLRDKFKSIYDITVDADTRI
jgi:hypothetical protein